VLNRYGAPRSERCGDAVLVTLVGLGPSGVWIDDDELALLDATD
jgi:hypothetical protein